MQLFDVLDPKLNLLESRFLEASAGTGKTFAIEHLFVRMLTETEETIALPEVLAVTFTREATREMKERIRLRLEAGESDRHEAALLRYDEVQVFTIHGFCHRMLTEFAFEADCPILVPSPEKATHIEEMRQVVEDFFETGDQLFAYDITALIRQSRYDMGKLMDRITQKMEDASDAPTTPKLGSMPSPSIEHLRHDYDLLAPRYKYLKVEQGHEQMEKLNAFLETRNETLLFDEKHWFFERMYEGNAKVKAAPLDTLPLHNPGFFEELHEQVSPFLSAFRDPDASIRRIAAECKKRWEVKAKETDAFSFGDLLRKMARALDRPAFVAKVREKYKAVIVDEFQDTDPVQWEIFERLFLDSHPLILVGDPKQSIYGFRSADIYTYMKARDSLGAERLAALGTNFRSSPDLVTTLNRLFSRQKDWLDLPALPGALTYHPVEAGRDSQALSGPSLVCPFIDWEIKKERTWPTKPLEEKVLFPYIAKEIVSLSGRVPLGEMAVLVKDRFQAERLSNFFSKCKIPSVMTKTISLAATKGFAAVEILVRARAHPKRGDFQRAASSGFLSTEHPLFSDAFRRTLPKSRMGQQVIQTLDLLMEEGQQDFEHLHKQMERWKRLTPQEEPRLTLRAEEGSSKVRLMTTFASKGLEFAVVFSLGMSCRTPAEKEGEERESEKMRKLYVAFTRARERLYVPCLFDTAEKPLVPGTASPTELFFAKWKLEKKALKEELEKMGAQVPIVTEGETPFLDSQEEETFEEDEDLPFTPPKTIETLTSFSAMATSHGGPLLMQTFSEQDLSTKSLHTMPLGAETGNVIHDLMETVFVKRHLPPEQIVCETLPSTHLSGFEEPIAEMIKEVLARRLSSGFALGGLQEGEYVPELEFLFPEGSQWVKGFADLIFEKEGKFYILDWKTNWLGSSDSAYSAEAMNRAMEEHDYFLQARLYGEALRRYLAKFTDAPFEKIYGGAYYVFLRGKKELYIAS